MAETRSAILKVWLLSVLRDLPAGGPRAVVHAAVEERFGSELTVEDRLPRVGRPAGEEAWRNNLDSLYDRLKHQGVLMPSAQGDPWRLPQPIAAADERLAGDLTEARLLRDFHPKSGDAYRSDIPAMTLIKSRDHERLLDQYGKSMIQSGWMASTMVHPRDLELRRSGETCLVEVKMVYHHNVTGAVRAAIAQLLEYRYYFYSADAPPFLLALFSEDVGGAHVGLLTSLGILSVWRNGDRWSGSTLASIHDLQPGLQGPGSDEY